jgi:DNA-directed RNA polymerase specialized sigma24 family protein
VLDAEAPSSKLALAQLAVPGVHARLLKIAKWSTESETEAEDLVAACLARVLDPEDSPWVPAERAFLRHMTFVIRRVWYRDRRRLVAQREVIDSRIANHEHTESPEPSPDDELERRRWLAARRKLGEQALASLGDDPIARRVIELGIEGLHGEGELAERVPCTVAEVKAALKRLERSAALAFDDWNREEQRRMATLQEQFAERVHQATGWKTEGTR